jgi:hypothetical protein
MTELPFQIDRWPVMLVAEPRSGSTALACHIAQSNGILYRHCVIEPDLAPQPGIIQNNWDTLQQTIAETNDRFVLKATIYPCTIEPEYQRLLASDCFKIMLYRRSRLDFIVSRLISQQLNKWHWYKHEVPQDYHIDITAIDPEYLDEAVREALNNQMITRNLLIDFVFDAVIAYEDIDLSSSLLYQPTPKPNNLSALEEHVRAYMREYDAVHIVDHTLPPRKT